MQNVKIATFMNDFKNEMKIKSGDRVKILRSGDASIPEIKEMIGKVRIVKRISRNGCVVVWNLKNTQGWAFSEDELELA